MTKPVVTTVDLTQHAEPLGTVGHTVAIVLPDGRVFDLWVYASPESTSIDVRIRRGIEHVNSDTFEPVRNLIQLPGIGPLNVVAVVA